MLGHSLFFGMRFSWPGPVQRPALPRRGHDRARPPGDGRQVLRRLGRREPLGELADEALDAAVFGADELPGYRAGPGWPRGGHRAGQGVPRGVTRAEGTCRPICRCSSRERRKRSSGLGSRCATSCAETLGSPLRCTRCRWRTLGPLFDGEAPWVAGSDIGWVDLDDWVYPYFHSAGHGNSFPLRDTS